MVGVAVRDQAARPPDHDRHHGGAEDQHAVLGEVRGQFGQGHQQDGGEHDADLAAHAAEHDDREDGGAIR